MLLSLTGRGGLARGRLLNRNPPALQQNVRVSIFTDSSKNAAGAASSSSRSQRGYGSLRFTHQVAAAVPPVVSVSQSSIIPPGSSFATATAVPKRSALVTDPKLESFRREVAQLALQELQVRTKQEWNFGSQFLEKYGYLWEESEEGEVVLTRDINRQRVRIRFAIADQQPETEEEDRDIVDAEPDPNKPQTKDSEDEVSFKGKPMAIQVSRIDLKGKEVATVVFYCQCGLDNSIIVDGVGGEDTESWGLKFDSLSPMLKDKIIDFLCELEIAGDVSKYVREYAANLAETNVSSINRLHQFFSTDEK